MALLNEETKRVSLVEKKNNGCTNALKVERFHQGATIPKLAMMSELELDQAISTAEETIAFMRKELAFVSKAYNSGSFIQRQFDKKRCQILKQQIQTTYSEIQKINSEKIRRKLKQKLDAKF